MLRCVHDVSGYPARWPDDPAGWLCPPGLMTACVAEQDGMVAGHVGLIRGVQADCLLQATGRDAGELAGVVRLFVDPAARRTGHVCELLHTAAANAVSGNPGGRARRRRRRASRNRSVRAIRVATRGSRERAVVDADWTDTNAAGAFGLL
jgi:GNAT superfamily N-acetyltransferase